MERILNELKRLLAEQVDSNIDIQDIDPDAPLLENGLNLDSVAIIDLIGLSEKAFRIEFREDDLCMDSFASLRALATVIEARRGETFDYIKEINTLCSELLDSHRPLLALKNIHSKRDLIQAIKLDLDKLTHALIEVRQGSASAILRHFFGDTEIDYANIESRLVNDRICHVGFEIHEPLDLVLHGIRQWIDRSNRTVGGNMRIQSYLRFPASEAFQRRVGAMTEIMRITLEVDGRGLLLELFDIHRPVDSALATGPAAPRHRNFAPLAKDETAGPEHRQRLSQLFAADGIWHYAVHVRQASDVVALHGQMESVVAANPCYRMAYPSPVRNSNDASFHTKVLRLAHGATERLELELVTRE